MTPFNATEFALPVIEFTKEEGYTTFTAEHGFDARDLIFHFYPPKDKNDLRTYWDKVFPVVLSHVAQKHFEATYPRLAAAYTVEFDSWWFRAHGYGQHPSTPYLIAEFYQKLDAALDAYPKSLED